MFWGYILSSVLYCGVDPNRDCSSVSLSTTTVIFYHNNLFQEYKLDRNGAEALMRDVFFDKSKRTVIFAHGFTRSPNSPGSLAVKDAFIRKNTTVNYFALNATDIFSGNLFSIRNYKNAARDSVCLGRELGKFLLHLNLHGVASSDIYLIGHSLGCPTISFASRHFTEATGKKIHRATGLDCVAPCFYPDDEAQLKPTDAELVDGIHTNMYGFGTSSTVGAADFYPNGGIIQRNCMFSLNPMCSHANALFYYSETVMSAACIGKQIVAWPNVSNMFTFTVNAKMAPMGYPWSGQTGSYYLTTNWDSPYCKRNPSKIYRPQTSAVSKLYLRKPFEFNN